MENERLIYEYDPNFFIPEGVKNFRPKTDIIDDSQATFEPINEQTETYSDEDSELDDDVSDDIPSVPEFISVVSQTVRTAPDGTQVVDMVIEVEDSSDSVKYDIRLAKA